MEREVLKAKKSTKSKRHLEYDEGADAQKKFERTMAALFRAPKSTSSKHKKGKD
jgi:hypothetical protein